jgi:hypothetical protein
MRLNTRVEALKGSVAFSSRGPRLAKIIRIKGIAASALGLFAIGPLLCRARSRGQDRL